MRRVAVVLAALILVALAPGLAAAQDRPPVTPTRDVDVVYMMVQPDAPGGPRVVEERMRWSVADGKLRIDPPTRGMWVLMDTRAKRVATVRDGERSVLEIDSASTMPGRAPPAGATFLRRGEASVAGLTCTEWETRDVTGAPTLACITADGVMLRAGAGARVLVEALSVSYGPQDPGVFRIPEGYQRITPPPVQRRTP